MKQSQLAPKRLLLAGNWAWEIYEAAFEAGFKACGWEVVRFRTTERLPSGFRGRIQQQFRIGPDVNALNERLVEACRESTPALILFVRPDMVFAETLRRIRAVSPGVRFVLYNNDNPYWGWFNRMRWRHYNRCSREADLTLAYRPSDIPLAQGVGARRVELIMPWYMSSLHHPLTDGAAPVHDVIFIGHYERDERAEWLEYLLENGVKLTVLGGGWQQLPPRYRALAAMQIKPVYGTDYCTAICQSKIALVFLSKKNHDVYTRRCYEIPACGTFMLAPRTRELEGLYLEGKEAAFYDGKEDLLAKVRYYLTHDGERRSVAEAGRLRCARDGDESARAREILRSLDENDDLA